jgi:general secretion pathway protein G
MKNRKGFTLIELMIVILVITVLATIVGLAVKNAGQRARESALQGHLRTLQNAVDLYHNDTGEWPSAIADVAADTSEVEGYHGPYVREVPVPPFGGDWEISDEGVVSATVTE